MNVHKDTINIPPVFAGAQIQAPAGMPALNQGAAAPAMQQSAAALQGGVTMHHSVPALIPGQSVRPPHVLPAAAAAAPAAAPAPAVPAQLTTPEPSESSDASTHHQGRYSGLVSSNDEAWDLANELQNSRFIPPALRGRVDDLFFLISRAAVAGIPWAATFDNLHAIPNRNGDLTMSMSVKAKMGICARHGCFQARLVWENGKPVAIAQGTRHGSSMQYEARYSFDDAALARRMTFKDGKFTGLNNVWEQYWPEMLKKRAMGRLLDIMFPDVLIGLPSDEELDMLLDAADSSSGAGADTAATRLQEGIAKTRRRRKEAKVVEPPAEPADAAADAATPPADAFPAPAPAATDLVSPEEALPAPGEASESDGLVIDMDMLNSQASM